MKRILRLCFLWLAILSTTAACSPIKKLDVSKADGYENTLQKVMIVTFAKVDYIHAQFENVLANQLTDRGVETIISHDIFPDLGLHIDPAVVFAKAKEMGVKHILVAKSVHEEEVRNIQRDGYTYGSVVAYNENSYFYGQGFFKTYRAYDSTFYNVVVNVYDVDEKKHVWSYLSQLKVAGSAQKAINQFIPTVVLQLEESHLL